MMKSFEIKVRAVPLLYLGLVLPPAPSPVLVFCDINDKKKTNSCLCRSIKTFLTVSCQNATQTLNTHNSVSCASVFSGSGAARLALALSSCFHLRNGLPALDSDWEWQYTTADCVPQLFHECRFQSLAAPGHIPHRCRIVAPTRLDCIAHSPHCPFAGCVCDVGE